ncbi:MAG: hypothetical protein QY328_13710 [Anaerolineales bacterium]|nr:hypothetical protein [Anaerolineales bacterium]WKZ39316.1 MAG: hypothetical protein QY328_13710 [Anaerolineales bacterium]
MKITQINVLKIVLCVILITGCATNTAVEAESLFTQMYKNCEMNTLLTMSFVGKLYEGDRNVNFSVEPTSNISVMFPVDNNVKLLWFDIEQSKWVEVINNVQYFPIDGKYIVGKNDPAKEYEYDLIGVIPVLGRKAELRIVIHGHTYENEIETDKCVGAYVDFEFTP